MSNEKAEKYDILFRPWRRKIIVQQYFIHSHEIILIAITVKLSFGTLRLFQPIATGRIIYSKSFVRFDPL